MKHFHSVIIILIAVISLLPFHAEHRNLLRLLATRSEFSLRRKLVKRLSWRSGTSR